MDSGFTSAQTITYVITVEIPNPGRTASIVGALTTAASVLEISSFFTLPQNTSGNVSIPITASVKPLAALTVQTSPDLRFSITSRYRLATAARTLKKEAVAKLIKVIAAAYFL